MAQTKRAAPARAARHRSAHPAQDARAGGQFGQQFVAAGRAARRSWRSACTPPSAKETWMPCAASSPATRVTSPAGVRTITLTSGWLVATCTSGWTCSIAFASALTSSVDIVHMPTPSTTTSCAQNAAKPQPPQGDRAHAAGRLQHDVDGVGVLPRMISRRGRAAGLHGQTIHHRGIHRQGRRGRGHRSAKLACTCSRSSPVSLARRSSCRSAIARVLRRAWPTGSP